MKRFLALLLLLTVACVLGPPALAQDKGSPSSVEDWQGLRGLRPGTVIIVYTRQGKEFEAKFADINGSILGVALDFRILDFEQRDIQEVRRKPSRRKGRIIGAVIGTFVGGMVTTAIGLKLETKQGSPFAESSAPALSAIGTFGGAAAGYAIGLQFDNKRKGQIVVPVALGFRLSQNRHQLFAQRDFAAVRKPHSHDARSIT